jgi:UDPglucose 6-dehydrogenase
MNILYVGAGFVGTCSAAVSAESGHKTLVFDIDEQKVALLGSNDRNSIESCLYEKGLADSILKNKERIVFTHDFLEVKKFLDSCDVIFICVATPEIGETGESNLEYYDAALATLASGLHERNNATQSKYIAIVNKSTVPIEMVDRTQEILKEAGIRNFGVVSNPEFLVEGKALEGSTKPDRVVIGAWTQMDFDIMRQVYQRFFDAPDVLYIEVNPREAAAGKLLANFILFNKLALCFDVVGRTCEAFSNLHFEQIRRILTSDPRIGTWGFYDSLYAGGSCFIKDSRSLSHQLQTNGVKADLVTGTYFANKYQLESFLSRAEKDAGFDWHQKNVAILGLSFKRDTNDIRNAPSTEIMKFLLEKDVGKVFLYDPIAKSVFARQFPASEKNIYMDHEYEAVKNVDIVIVATDWPQFRGLADTMITELKSRPLILDGRRMFQHRYGDLVSAGFDVIAVGSSFLKAK